MSLNSILLKKFLLSVLTFIPHVTTALRIAALCCIRCRAGRVRRSNDGSSTDAVDRCRCTRLQATDPGSHATADEHDRMSNQEHY